MTDREICIAAREMARQSGACDHVLSKWSDDADIDELLDLYIRTFDFATEKDFPPLEFMSRNLRTEDLHRHNIYLNEEVQIADAENGYYVFLGRCTGTLWVNGLKAVTVLVRHDSVINVEAFDGARVQVRYFDSSDGVCKSDSYSRVKKINGGLTHGTPNPTT